MMWQPVGGGRNFPAKTDYLQCPTRSNRPFEIVADYRALPNPSSADLTNENPGATAIATGANDVVEHVCFFCQYIASFPALAMLWGALE
jgi:hypothetical protein